MPQQCMLCSHATAMRDLQQLQGVMVVWPGFTVMRFTVKPEPQHCIGRLSAHQALSVVLKAFAGQAGCTCED